jgi:hypothetical protein
LFLSALRQPTVPKACRRARPHERPERRDTPDFGPIRHEALLLLFRNRPALAPELLRDALHVVLPPFSDARIDSAEVTDIEPAQYRADLVILLLDGVPVYGIVIEVQLQPDARKRFVWPVYVTNLRARHELPVETDGGCILTWYWLR